MSSYCKDGVHFSHSGENTAISGYEQGQVPENYTVPENVTEICNNAFKNCADLKSVIISEGVTSIGTEAFFGCTNLKSVTLPKSLKTIGSNAFSQCGIEKVYINDLKAFCEIEFKRWGSNPLKGATLYINKKSVKDLIISQGTEHIGNDAFEECKGLKSITIPNSVKTIGEGAFKNIEAESIFMPKTITKIGSGAFWDSKIQKFYIEDMGAFVKIECESIFGYGNPLSGDVKIYTNGEYTEDLTIPEGTSHIGNHAFHGCKNISSVTIEEGVKSIGWEAFRDCSNLKTITLPESLESTGDDAFYGCTAIEKVYVNDVAKFSRIKFGPNKANPLVYGAKLYKKESEDKPVTVDLVIPAGTKTIEPYSHRDLTFIETLTIPNGVKSIGKGAFEGCTGLKSVFIPDSVEIIDWSAFEGCSSLEKVRLPRNLKFLPWRAFHECTSLKEVILPDGAISKDFARYKNFMQKIPIKECIIPKSVYVIGDYAFSENNHHYIESVILHDKITCIGDWAFDNCLKLKEIIVPDSVEYIGKGAFAGSGIERVVLGKNIRKIEKFTFSGCKNLKEIVVRGEIWEIGEDAFYGCPYLGPGTAKKVSIGEILDGWEIYTEDAYHCDYTAGPYKEVISSHTSPVTLSMAVIENGRVTGIAYNGKTYELKNQMLHAGDAVCVEHNPVLERVRQECTYLRRKPDSKYIDINKVSANDSSWLEWLNNQRQE